MAHIASLIRELEQKMRREQNDMAKFNADAQPAQSTVQKELQAKALAALGELGSASVQEDAVQFSGSGFVLPQQFSGRLADAADFLLDLEKQERTMFAFGRAFDARPFDGAAAFQRALIRVFGSSGLGRITPGGFFSPDIPPQLISVNVGVGETLQVPWGIIDMPPLQAQFTLAMTKHPDKGQLFYLSVEAPRNKRQQLEGFFDVVQNELTERSLYRGKAFDGAGEPNFIDVTTVDPAAVVYSEEVYAQLEANVWSLIRYTDKMVKRGLPLKRAALLEGPWGTGKSLAGVLTAQLAAKHGWTFIQARPGRDNLADVLATAKLYQPCVVQFEDVDTVISENPDENSALLDALDGIGNKGVHVITLMTTNHMEKIRKAVMRPGRIDSIIHVGELDASGVERLVKVTIPAESLAADIDWPAVHTAFVDFLPAFITEACDRASRYSMVRNNGDVGSITAQDLAHAAVGLRPHLDAMLGAAAGPAPVPTLDKAFRELVVSGIDGTKVLDYEGDFNGNLVGAGK